MHLMKHHQKVSTIVLDAIPPSKVLPPPIPEVYVQKWTNAFDLFHHTGNTVKMRRRNGKIFTSVIGFRQNPDISIYTVMIDNYSYTGKGQQYDGQNHPMDIVAILV